MISFLTGKPLIIGQELVILTNGVGYGVKVTNQVLSNYSSIDKIDLYIYTHVKEDVLELYGFESLNDRNLFKLLISVSGIGPTTAIAILNKGSNQVINAIQKADVAFFTSVKRVGKKAGQKIIIDLKTKLGGVKDLDLSSLSQNESYIHEALISMGFDDALVTQLIKENDFSDIPIEKAIQTILKQLGKK